MCPKKPISVTCVMWWYVELCRNLYQKIELIIPHSCYWAFFKINNGVSVMSGVIWPSCYLCIYPHDTWQWQFAI